MTFCSSDREELERLLALAERPAVRTLLQGEICNIDARIAAQKKAEAKALETGSTVVNPVSERSESSDVKKTTEVKFLEIKQYEIKKGLGYNDPKVRNLLELVLGFSRIDYNPHTEFYN